MKELSLFGIFHPRKPTVVELLLMQDDPGLIGNYWWTFPAEIGSSDVDYITNVLLIVRDKFLDNLKGYSVE